jgi:uncharacterized RDD family membrane protein YckC
VRVVEQTMLARRPGHRTRAADRLAAAFLIALMVVGAFALWIAIPLGCLWLSAKLASSSGEQYLLDLPLTVAMMIAFGYFLIWLNRLYLRVTGVIARYAADEDEYGPGSAPRFLRGPLEPVLVASLVIALIGISVWFFVLAENPSVPTSFAP